MRAQHQRRNPAGRGRQHRHAPCAPSPAYACSTSSRMRRTTAASSPLPAMPPPCERASPCCSTEAVKAIDLRTAPRRAPAHGRRGRRPVHPDRRRRPWPSAWRWHARSPTDVAARVSVPVFLYEEAGTNPARKNLEDIRRGEFEGLAAKMAQPAWAPDFGPAAPHVSAGATRDRRPHAAHRLQHQPRHRSPRRRQEDRHGDPDEQRRAPLRQGDGHRARRPRASCRCR